MSELGFWPLIHLALVIYAMVQIFGSNADIADLGPRLLRRDTDRAL